MKYDRTEFTVQPGMKVRIVLKNPDAMDHNLIMVQPGAAAKVAIEAAKMETTGEGVEKQWIPDSDEILFASNLLSRGEAESIEFTAPDEEGIYDYICTFPGHWQLMRGVMIVAEEPMERILVANKGKASVERRKSRELVEYWEFDQLKGEVDAVLANRSYKTGKEMFEVASCLQCHMIAGTGKAIGPDLTEVNTKYTPEQLLQHVIDPSLEVADEYKTYIVQTDGFDEYYGQIVSEDEDSIQILDNPLEPESAVTVKKSDIAEMEQVSISAMPTDLLATLNKNEIWDLLAYVMAGGDKDHVAFQHAH